MTPDNAVLFLHALTGLHPGSGTALGVVDLPVQRERHTGWPMIAGSSLKGVLREAFRSKLDAEAWFGLFGPDTSKAAENAGAATFTDARILAFPVRSLRGVFAWVTCPAALERLKRDLSLTRIPPWKGALPPVAKETFLCAADSPLLIEQNHALLEEFEFRRTGDANEFCAWLADNAAVDDDAAKRMKSHVAILHDDDFTHFVRYATEIAARIAIDSNTRTVKDTALFFQELLPPETLLYALTFVQNSRRDKNKKSSDLMEELTTGFPKTVQIGADETIGRGLCRTRLSLTSKSLTSEEKRR